MQSFESFIVLSVKTYLSGKDISGVLPKVIYKTFFHAKDKRLRSSEQNKNRTNSRKNTKINIQTFEICSEVCSEILYSKRAFNMQCRENIGHCKRPGLAYIFIMVNIYTTR